MPSLDFSWTVRELTRRPGRPGLRLLLLASCLFMGFHAAHETLWSRRYFKVDPFALEAPVQWPVTGRHGAALARDADALRPCLPDDTYVAVGAPHGWAEQRFYLYMWLVYALPRQRVLPPDDPSAAERADLFLAFDGAGPWSPEPPAGFVPLPGCRAGHWVLYGPDGAP